jgi:hypothetical protein
MTIPDFSLGYHFMVIGNSAAEVFRFNPLAVGFFTVKGLLVGKLGHGMYSEKGRKCPRKTLAIFCKGQAWKL